MPTYRAPTRDQLFVLHDLLRVSEQDVPGYADLDRDTTAAILEESGRVAAEVLQPLNAVGDEVGCVLENGVVRAPPGFAGAFAAMREGGWTAIDCAPEYGGQGLPYLMHTAAQEPFVSANMAFNMYMGLTHGAYTAILLHGTDDQRRRWLPRLASCEWTGTMNLTEPHAGTDLGLLRTRAVPQPDGSYRLTGQKIFISAGDHDLAANIVHLVLARIPGGPEGIKGVSLFVVPKVRVSDDGTLGPRNGVTCGKVERKMGIHGNATCALNYDDAWGELLGEPHKGMRAMFSMMNEARLGVALQGYAVAEAAHQGAVAYARDRLQGRDATGAQNPGGAADPIIVHPDIRRVLMDGRSFVEGARALTYWGASLIDRAHAGDDGAEALISLLTPVLKGFQTDRGFEVTVAAQQIFGGHGYVEDWGMSQLARDARIAMIYEGANGVQALDLVARKLPQGGGRAFMAFLQEVKDTIRAHEHDAELKAAVLDPLKAASKDLQAAAMFFMAEGPKDPNAALAGSTDFLHLMGHVALGLMWARMAAAARAGLDAGPDDAAFLEAKLRTARYYAARQLPATALHLARITSGAGPVMALDAASF